MNVSGSLFRIAACALVCFYVSAVNAQGNKSSWVYTDANGKLSYKTLEKGDRIMDFSDAGYMGGGVALPIVPVKVTISAVNGDNTDAINNAINEVARLPLVNGLRGAVLLNKGVYNCEREINLNASGVVLRGSGQGTDGTIINMIGKAHVGIVVKGSTNTKTTGAKAKITDAYVASGTNTFNIDNANGFAAGDSIRITKPITDKWVSFMGMDNLVRDGKKQTWINGVLTTERVIRKIEGKKIVLDIPLTDSYDATYTDNNTTVEKIKTTGELSQIGIENLRITCADQAVAITDAHYSGFKMGGVRDAWAKDVSIYNAVNSITLTGSRITLDGINMAHTLPTKGAAKPADLNTSGAQLLFNHCNITGDNLFFMATGAKVTGPIVLLNCIFKGNGWIQPHQRWATGLLIDNCQVPDGGIDFMNRGEMGSGHGWAIGWAVAWNCIAKSYLNQQPPGAANWVIGSKGDHDKKPIPFEKAAPLLPEGIYDSPGKKVMPESLYLNQLAERLGKQAVKNIGY